MQTSSLFFLPFNSQNFVNRVCTSMFHPLSYPLRSLDLTQDARKRFAEQESKRSAVRSKSADFIAHTHIFQTAQAYICVCVYLCIGFKEL